MSKYPVIEVGDPVTADMLNGMLPDITYKAAATIRASTVAFSDDPDLITPTLVANGTYLVEFFLRYATTLAAAINTKWNVPVGVLSANRTVQGLGQVGTTGSKDNTPSGTLFAMRQGVHGYTTTVAYGSRDDVTLQCDLVETSTIIMGATAGPVAFQWAQLVSTAVNTVVSAGSYVKTTRMG